jgi:hypothetical protein
MFPTFFKHKFREVKSFLRIMRGKLTDSPKERVRGVDQALEAMKDEKKVYQQEKLDALNKQKNGDKVRRETGENRDISAI